jgi:hypothetical protein
MFCTFLVMAAIEISLLIDKPGARVFAGSVVAVGLVLHGISVARKRMQPAAPTPEAEKALPLPSAPTRSSYRTPRQLEALNNERKNSFLEKTVSATLFQNA